MEELLVPLFPLEIVLLPEEPLPLHIFEERYKEMIGDCLRAQEEGTVPQEFGVVLAQGGEMQRTGCCARIVNVTRRYEDGRMDIFTVGTRRIEILFTNRERSFLRGGVEFFDDEENADVPGEAEAARAIELFRQILLRLRRASEIPVHFARPYRRLSFRIAASLPLDLNFKQQLLTLRQEPERLQKTVETLEQLLPQLDRIEKARAKVGGNGHGG
jgi:ATP-dependent Lon protease